MTSKRLHTVQFDGHTVTLIETRSHRLFVQYAYAGDCIGGIIRVNARASEMVRMAVAAYAVRYGMAVV